MELLRRHRVVVGLILIVALSVLGWQLLPDSSQLPMPEAQQETATTPPTSMQKPSGAESSVNIATPASRAATPGNATLRGRAVDATTGAPVRNFEMSWREPIGEAWRSMAKRRRTFETTDGRFVYPDVPPGKWILTVKAQGYQRFELPELRIAGGTTQELRLTLQKGHVLRGRVYDEASGAGVAARIDVLDPSAMMAERGSARGVENAAGQDGSFVIEGVPPGRTTLVIEAKNFTSRTLLVEVGANTPSLEIGLSAGGIIAGRFTTADGAPVVGGSVSLDRADGTSRNNIDTGATGAFEFRGLTPEKYRLSGRFGTALVTQEIQLEGSALNVRLALPAGRTIRGTVTGLRPEVLQQVGVVVRREGELMWSHNRVNQRGEFELNNVAPGPVRVVADINNMREVSKSIEMPADADVTINLDFPSGAVLSGRVTRNNQPLADIDFMVCPADRGNPTNWYRARTSGTGTYEVRDMEPGEYAVLIGSFLSKPQQVHGQAVFNIDVPGGDFKGRVLDDSSGVPMAGAAVDVHFADGAVLPVRLNATSDHLGQFRFASVVPAEYVLTVYKPGYRLYRERMSFDARGDAPTIRLRQERGVEVKGRDAATGKPVREILVIEQTSDRSGGISTNLQLDENGVGYLPSGLAGSTLRLVALGSGSVEIPSWDGAALDLRFELSTRK